MAKIDILMATYNGATYLHQQIDSILNQTETDWQLIIRDDGSTDNTPELLQQLAADHPDRIKIIIDGKGNLGPLENFNTLFALSKAPYCGFSDQDDLWKPNKLEHALAQMKELEKDSNSLPLMVFADREIIDTKNNILVPSYCKRQGQKPNEFPDLISHLSMCVAAGSTMLINDALRQKCLPIPSESRMHDTWIELVAAAFGKRAFLDEIALSYRRHDANVSGGQQTFKESRNIIARALRLSKSLSIQRNVYSIYFIQAQKFYSSFGKDLDGKTRKRLQSFISLPNSNIFKRAYLILSENLGPAGWERKLAFIALSSKKSKD